MLNFTSTILAGGILGLAAANRDAFANHRMALESILSEENYADYGHHAAPDHREPAVHHEPTMHHEDRHYDHEEYYGHHAVAEHHYEDEHRHFDHGYLEHGQHYGHPVDHFVDEYDESCGRKDFCHRFSQMLAHDEHHEHAYRHEDYRHHVAETATYYVEPDSVIVHEDAIRARLDLHHRHEHEYYSNDIDTDFRAAHLDLHIALFQEGIMQVKIKASEEEERFTISNSGIGIDWDNIKVQQRMHDFVKILDDGLLISGQDNVSYKLQFDPFRLIQYVDGVETIIVNDNDNLYYDAKDMFPHEAAHHEALHHEAPHHEAPHHITTPHPDAPVHHDILGAPVHHDVLGTPSTHHDVVGAPIHHEVPKHAAPAHHDAPKHATPAHAKKNGADVPNSRMSGVHGYAVGMDFTVNAEHMFGLPQRADNFRLEDTGYDHPYRLFNQDRNKHNQEGKNDEPLYGTVPYIMGHSPYLDASVAWMNSAETFVFLNSAHHGDKTNSAFVSEGNALEFYLLGAEASPKKLQKKLAELTGYTPMPPMHSLGYNFAKWEDNSAHQIVERNHDFTKFGFPVDVFWFDSEYAQDYEYGEFDHKRFSQDDVMHMNNQVHDSGRRFVIAADPHIRASKDYFMYKEGMLKQGKLVDDFHVANLFVRDASAEKAFVGESRAGKSVWIDFLNDSACEYWKDLFHPSVFKGTNYMYGVWNDLNEPSVFKTAEHQHTRAMPLATTHMTTEGDILQHRWIHNAYGALQQRATYQGLLRRDRGQQRPFLLSRSFFMGSQRYGAVAAGSNHAKFEDVELSVNMLLSLGVSGIPFAGHDVPGYAGVPIDDLFVQFYQLGVYYPFFRANSEKGFEMREPWLQSPRVQRAINAAIKQRYAQSHYMYNAFFESTQAGHPIVRPMWYEFPQDEFTFDLNHQFMFGEHILVSPKIGQPCIENAVAGATTEISVYLPPTFQWYDIYSKLEMDTHDDIFYMNIADSEQGTFVKGGAILPVLNFADSAESLLQAIEDPIRLEIYCDTMGEHPYAAGHLYLDDGENHNNRHHERTQVRYEYDGHIISVEKSISDENMYAKAATKIIDEVMIFGVEQAPKRVLNKFAMQASGQGEVDVHHVYVESTKMVHLWHLRIPVDEGLFHGHPVDLLELVY